jgi:transposase
MQKIQETLQAQSTTDQDIMYIAFELSNSTWRMAFSDDNKKRHATIKARDLQQLEVEIDKAKRRFRLKDKTQIKSCYEAGRDGFWIHLFFEFFKKFTYFLYSDINIHTYSHGGYPVEIY